MLLLRHRYDRETTDHSIFLSDLLRDPSIQKMKQILSATEEDV